MVISFVYMSPFLAVERARGNSNGRIVLHHLMWLAMKLIVAHFCRAKDHESMKGQSMCGQKTRCSFTPSPASYEPATMQPIALSAYRWPVGSQPRSHAHEPGNEANIHR